jgi:hypothetical protein
MTLSFRIFLSALSTAFFLLPSAALAASLNLSPNNTTVGAGATFTETVFVSSTDQAMNAISGAISFPSDLLQVVSISKANSVLSLWVQDPTFSNTDGTISWSGVVPNPGYTGSRGQAVSIQFRARKTGTAAIVFASASQVLANDGNGTDILTGTGSATIIITSATPIQTPPPPPPSTTVNGDLFARITSSTHPDQTQWYNISHAVFDWTNAQNVSAIRLGYDQNADGAPGVLYSEPVSHKELDLADGISYFHVQERDSSGWGPVSSYRVQIDTVPPLPFTVTFPQGTTTPSGSPISALFTALDELSGIDHYQVAIDGKELTITADEGTRPYVVSADAGAHMLLVRAYDKAGNFSLANGRFFMTGGTTSPPFDFFSFGWLAVNYVSLFLIALAILITLIFAAWYIRTHFTAYRRQLNHKLGLTHAHVHKEFDNLKGAITEEILTLEKAKSERALTREEERIVARFKKLLDQAERAIERDIEDLPR